MMQRVPFLVTILPVFLLTSIGFYVSFLVTVVVISGLLGFNKRKTQRLEHRLS